ncbi:MAG: hypothetical protein EXR71_04205 [Myxococcales bacterium]|nr:hypothetical protein [Myxococcales bacterium]
MGLRDRLRLLVRPPPVPSRERPAAAPAPSNACPPVRPPRVTNIVPLGATVIDSAAGDQPSTWPSLSGRVVVTGGPWAAAVAERIASYGRADVAWLDEPSR